MNNFEEKNRNSIDDLLNNVHNDDGDNSQTLNSQQQDVPNYFGSEYYFAKGNWSLDRDRINDGIDKNFGDLNDPALGENPNLLQIISKLSEQMEPTYGYGINPENYAMVGCGSINSNWMVITTCNGYQAWKHVNGKFHPVHTNPDFIQQTGCEGEFVWFDRCSDFIGNGNPYARGYGGLFRRKEKKHYAIGRVDNIAYKVYADGTFDLEPYQQFHNYTKVDKNNNKIEGNYFQDGVVNSDGTYTTNFLIQNNEDFDPNKFLRIRFDDRTLLQKFFYIWGNTMNNSNNGKNIKVGFNDNGGNDRYFFIDMPNGPRIYDYVISLYYNLKNNNIKYNQLDSEVYKNFHSVHKGARYAPYGYDVPQTQYDPMDERNDCQTQNKIAREYPDIIIFGVRIPY